MAASNTSKTPYEIIEQEKKAYLEELPEPDPDWPTDVKIILEAFGMADSKRAAGRRPGLS